MRLLGGIRWRETDGREMGAQSGRQIRTRWWEHELWRRGSKRVGKRDKPEGDKNGVLETRVWKMRQRR